MDTVLFRTNVGLTYFRQERDGKKLTDDALVVLYDQIRKIEESAFSPVSDKGDFGWRWYNPAAAPFDLLPCHRAIMLEVQGEKWVLAREYNAGMREIQRLANTEERNARVEAYRKQRAALAKQLRDL